VALAPGTKLGPYDIAALIGTGGMGEVYRATDTRLGRTVAIKVIANRWRERPDLRARFRIEAEAIAALNHPHIAQLFDVGHDGELDYLVMEHIEGETLAARLARGRLPLALALDYAKAIAAALGHAHRRKIIHRDVKPANVIITREGPKLLDFGVARSVEPSIAESTVAASDRPLTEPGATVGTWRYMAPEQLTGGAVDTRTDVFALGCVIYEMLAGRRAFHATSPHELVTAILTAAAVDLHAVDRAIPASLATIVRTCLAKEPDDRWQSGDDVRRALDAATVTPSLSRLLWNAGAAIAALTAVIAAALAAITLWPTRDGHIPGHTVRSTIDLPPDMSVETGFASVVFTPDGQSVVYMARGKQFELRRYRLTDATDTAIAGAQGGTTPFISPDGQWVGFFESGYLKKVSINGGTPTTLCAAQSPFGGTWGDDGSIVFSHMPETGLFRIAASGGTPELVTRLAPEDAGNDHRYPQFLPGGRGLLYAVATGPENTARIVVADLRTGQRKELVQGAASARFVSPGHLAYVRNGELFLSPFSLDRLEMSGPARRIATGVAEGTNGAPEFAFSGAGELVYLAGRGAPNNRLAFVDLQGKVTLIDSPPQYSDRPRISPDGRTIAYYVGAAKNNVWLFDVDRGTTARRTFGRYHEPVWSPDGRLAVAEGGPGAQRIVLLSRDGSGSDEVLVERAGPQFPESWSPDGRTLVYRAVKADGHWDLWAVTASTREQHAITASPFDESHARFSPNGRWIAYISNETGRSELYVRSSEPNGGRWLISSSGASGAAWAPNGRRLYFRGAQALWVVEVTEARQFSASRPQLLFRAPQLGPIFDIMPDGQRFIMIQRDPTPPVTKLHLVLNPLATAIEAAQ
jgi:serine/threonine-protein kinase